MGYKFMKLSTRNERVIELIKERIKFYILGYAMGIMGPLVAQIKHKDVEFFFPLNLLILLSAIGLGTAAYYGSIHMPLLKGVIRGLKYIIAIIIVVIIATLIEMYLINNYGINIKPFIGF